MSSPINPVVERSSFFELPIEAEDTLVKIKKLIEKKQEELLCCPISLEYPKEPVITNCNHVFERLKVWEWILKANECPVCRSVAPTFTALKEPIVKFPPTSLQQPRVAEYFITAAVSCISINDYEGALYACEGAFKYNQRSEDYIFVPMAYRNLGDKKKEELSFLYLSLYQCEEGKITEALTTLNGLNRD